MYYEEMCLVTTPRGYALLVDMATDGTLTGFVLSGLKKILNEAKAEFFPKGKYVLLKWKDGFIREENEGYLYNALTKLKEKDVDYKFMRIGDRPGDIEEKHNGRTYLLPDLYVARRIEVWPDDGPGQDLSFLKDFHPGDYKALLEKVAADFQRNKN